MPAHLREAAVVVAIPVDEDRVHGRLHVVVDAARAGLAEEGESPVMGIERHLLRLARISPNKEHAAVTRPHDLTTFGKTLPK
jgi:hypothetical protein